MSRTTSTQVQAAPTRVRQATTPRQFDRSSGGWTDRATNWFTVECWRALATNVKQSMERGHPVVVTGRFRTNEWQDEEGAPRSKLILEAFGVGHDLSRGTATFVKTPPRPQLQDTPPLEQDVPSPLDQAPDSQAA